MESKPLLRAASAALVALLAVTACAPGRTLPATPTAAATSLPAATPAATLALVPDVTLAPALEPSPTALATAGPFPTQEAQKVEQPTSPLPPAERLERGLAEQRNGNYEAASALFRSLVDSGAPSDVQRQALLRLGQCDLEVKSYRAAADELSRFLASYPDDPHTPAALFWLGRARAGLGDGQGAAEAYRRYIEGHPLMVSYVQERIGNALLAANDPAGAATAFRTAADAENVASNKAGLLESLAKAERTRQGYDQAVSAYGEILQFAQVAGYRAQIMYEIGATLQEAKRNAEAAAHWNELVNTYPESAQAAKALATLDQWQLAQVDPLIRARVDYAAGLNQEALAVLRQWMHEDPYGHAAAAHYYAALAHRKLGQHKDSVREFDLLIQTHPENSLTPQAWWEKGESLALLGQVDEAVAALQQVVARYPQQALAIRAPWRIAQIYESAGRDWDAVAAYTRAAAAHPDASYASDARFQAGFVHYLAGRVQAAAQKWAEVLPQEGNATMRARLLLWLGKAAARQKDQAGAQKQWQLAQAASPDSYWGLRARDLMAGRRFAGRAPAGAFNPARYAPRGDQGEAEAWLLSWAGAPPGNQPVSTLPEDVTSDIAFQRGSELWELGDAASASAQLRQVQVAFGKDARALYALALHCRNQGLYQVSILAAQRILELAPAQARQQTPRFIEELAYPTYYADLVLQEAQPTNTDPLLFFALVRQESVFDAAATSYSDARGLAQVIPSTGKYIAKQLGDASYAPDRLWRPAVSIRYGLWYISRALTMFDDNALMALVGYNAGPGNAASWGKLAKGDDDVYFERVSNSQPRAYMQKIYEHRAHYEKLYF